MVKLKTGLFLGILLFVFSEFNAQNILMARHRGGFQIGVGYDLNYLKSDYFNLNNKGSISYSLGGVYEYVISDKLAFRTGLSYDRSGGSVSDISTDTVRATYYDVMPYVFDDQVLSLQDAQNSMEIFYVLEPGMNSLDHRKYHFNQFTIPLEIYLRTKMKGFRRFYIKSGLHLGLLFRAGADDFCYSPYGSKQPKNDVFFKDKNTFQPELTFGLGWEWAFVGRTSFFMDLETDLPFRNYFKQDEILAPYFSRGITPSEYTKPEDIGNVPLESNNFYQLHFRVKMGFIF